MSADQRDLVTITSDYRKLYFRESKINGMALALTKYYAGWEYSYTNTTSIVKILNQ